jgi:DMSO/TMAO reductase YedYZ molybdopterin-dependent catalytic subunit
MRGKWWMAGVLAVALSMLSAGPAAAHGARAHHRHHGGSRTVTISGAVATPHTYTLAELAALPQQSFTVGQRSGTGASLEDLVNTAGPTLPATKNANLRVTVTVQGPASR